MSLLLASARFGRWFLGHLLRSILLPLLNVNDEHTASTPRHTGDNDITRKVSHSIHLLR